MRAVTINEYAPVEAKLALADDSTEHDSPGDSATPTAPVVIDAEAPR